MADIRIAKADGSIATVPEENLAEARKLGWEPATEAQWAERKGPGAVGTFLASTATGALSAAVAPAKLATAATSALTGIADPLEGLSAAQAVADAAGVAEGVMGGNAAAAADAAAAELRAGSVAHGGAALAGNIVGGLAAGGPLSRIAAAGGGALMSGLGLAGRAAQVGSLATAGAIEGTVLGGSAAADEAWVQGRELTAEQVLAASGMGGLLGGAGGGLIGTWLTRGGRAAGRAAAAAPGPAALADDLVPAPGGPSVAGMLGDLPPGAGARGGARGAASAAEGGMPSVASILDAGAPPGAGRAAGGGGAGRAAREAAEGVFEEGAEAAGSATGRVLDEAEGWLGRAQRLGRRVYDEAEDWGRKRVERMTPEQRAKLEARVDELAVAAVARTDAKAMRDVTRATGARATEEIRRMGRRLRDLGIVDAVEGGRRGMGLDEMAERAGIVRESTGEALGNAVRGVSAVAGDLPLERVMKPLRDLVGSMPRNTTSDVRLANQVTRVVEPFAKRTASEGGATTLEKVWELRRSIDSEINFSRGDPTKKDRHKMLESLRGKIEQVIEEEVDRVGKAGGADELRDAYRAAKADYSAASWADKHLRTQLNRAVTNRKLSLTDTIVGAAALGSGVAAGPAGVAGALALAGANKMLREYGDATAVGLARRVLRSPVDPSRAAAVVRQSASRAAETSRAVDDEIVGGVLRSLTGRRGGGGAGGAGGRRAAPPPGPGGLPVGGRGGAPGLPQGPTAKALRSGDPEAYRRHAEALAVAATPDGAAQAVERMVAERLGSAAVVHAPGLVAAVGQAAARAVAYLQSVAPAPAQDPDSITPHLEPPPPVSPDAIEQYSHRLEGVENPMSILHDLERGVVVPEKVEAVQAVWPELYQRMQQTTFAALAEARDPVEYDRRVLLELALGGGGALEPSLRPEVLALMHSTAGLEQQQQGPRMRPPPAGGGLGKVQSTRTARLMG